MQKQSIFVFEMKVQHYEKKTNENGVSNLAGDPRIADNVQKEGHLRILLKFNIPANLSNAYGVSKLAGGPKIAVNARTRRMFEF